jgi:predicted dehydrogenase
MCGPANVPAIEIYGSLGTLSVPDPNNFGGPVRLWRSSTRAWEDVPLVPGWAENSRSIGLADMAHAIAQRSPAPCQRRPGFHVLDIMHAVHDASDQGKHIDLQPGRTTRRAAWTYQKTDWTTETKVLDTR